jgi:long-subunit fatty acid transport protein
MAVRFTPSLDAGNKAPAGKLFTIPVTVASQSGAGPDTVKQLAVQVSYDDGKTWQPTKAQRVGSGWTVTVAHPASGGFVSLRATATDSAGNTVDQTIVHAYGLRTN